VTIKAEHSKNRKEGRLPLNAVALTTLAAIKPPQAEGRVFGYHSPSETFSRAAKCAGLPGVSCHTLRHTFATRLVVAGVPLGVVKELMRHSSINMTMRYSHAQMDHLRGAVD
jgi:integrase